MRARMTRSLHWAKETTFTSDDILATHRLLTKTGDDIEQRFFELGERRASQGVTLSDFCWAIAVIKEHLWEFLERQGFKRGPVEI